MAATPVTWLLRDTLVIKSNVADSTGIIFYPHYKVRVEDIDYSKGTTTVKCTTGICSRSHVFDNQALATAVAAPTPNGQGKQCVAMTNTMYEVHTPFESASYQRFLVGEKFSTISYNPGTDTFQGYHPKHGYQDVRTSLIETCCAEAPNLGNNNAPATNTPPPSNAPQRSPQGIAGLSPTAYVGSTFIVQNSFSTHGGHTLRCGETFTVLSYLPTSDSYEVDTGYIIGNVDAYHLVNYCGVYIKAGVSPTPLTSNLGASILGANALSGYLTMKFDAPPKSYGQAPKCECGTSAVGGDMHSDYCPLAPELKKN